MISKIIVALLFFLVVPVGFVQAGQAQKSTVSQHKTHGSLGFGPKEFKNRFNKAAITFGTNLRIKNIKIENGSVQNAFTYAFTDNLAITGSINKNDGSVRWITLIGNPASTKDSFNFIVCIGCSIKASSPELSPDQRGEILSDLGMTSGNISDNSVILNGKIYTVKLIPQIGIVFGVSDASDN